MTKETITTKTDDLNRIHVNINHVGTPLPSKLSLPTPAFLDARKSRKTVNDSYAIRPTEACERYEDISTTDPSISEANSIVDRSSAESAGKTVTKVVDDAIVAVMAHEDDAVPNQINEEESTSTTAQHSDPTPDLHPPLRPPKKPAPKKRRRRRRTPLPQLLHKILTRPAPPPSDTTGHAWCCECACDHPTPSCPELGPARFVEDNPPPSMAFATCPPCLRIGVVPTGEPVKAVFAKRSIPARSWFGPFRAELAESETVDCMYPTDPGPGHTRFLLPVSVTDEEGCKATRWLVRTSEVVSSWMMFVRPAESVEMQNCVALQFQGGVYLSTVTAMQRGDEMRAWYAPSYARAWGLPLLAPPEEPEEEVQAARETTPPPASPLPTLTPSPTRQQQQPVLMAALRRSSRQRSGVTCCPSPPPSPCTKTPEERRQMRSTVSAARRMLRSAVKRQVRRKALLLRCVHDEMFCFDCHLTFSDENLFQVHKLKHRGFPPDNQVAGCVCSVCRLKLPHLAAYTEHVAVHAVHPTFFHEAPGLPALDRRDGEYACGQCGHRTITHRELCLHKQQQHVLPDATNAVKRVSAEDELVPITDEERGVQPEFVCPVCKEIFQSANGLATHIKKHSGDSFYACAVCQESMPSKGHYVQHGEKHRHNGVFPCPFCASERPQSTRLGVYRTFARLNRHISHVHTARSHPCPYCPRSFRRRPKLVQHLSCHIDTPGFVCERCGQRFKRKDKLSRHMRNRHEARSVDKSRTGQRVACPHCSLTFAYRTSLQRHVTRQHAGPQAPTPRLQCQFCSKSYVHETALNRHIERSHAAAVGGSRPLPEPVAQDLGGMMLPPEDAGAASLSELLMAPAHTFLQTEAPAEPLFEAVIPDCLPAQQQHYLVMLQGEEAAMEAQETMQWRQIGNEESAGFPIYISNVAGDAQAQIDSQVNSPSLLEELGQQAQGSLLAEVLPHGLTNELLSPDGQGVQHPPGSWML